MSTEPIPPATAVHSVLIETPKQAAGMSYRAAVHLAAAQRRGGAFCYAVYDVALGHWTVR